MLEKCGEARGGAEEGGDIARCGQVACDFEEELVREAAGVLGQLWEGGDNVPREAVRREYRTSWDGHGFGGFRGK